MAHPDDAVAIAGLNREFNDSSATPEQIAARLCAGQQTETVLLAEVDSRAVGFACVQVICSVCYAQPWAELTELYVQTPYRRRGLGRALVQHAERLAQQCGATDMILRTGTENMTGQAFYRSLGYTTQKDLLFHKPLGRR